jgi:ankyrin repeat protein
MVSVLISAGADVNYFASDLCHVPAHRTALDLALDDGKDAIIKVLTAAGAVKWEMLVLTTSDLFSVTSTGTSTFEIVPDPHMLLKASDKDKENALRVAVLEDQLPLVQGLLALKTNPSTLFRNSSILCLASMWGKTDIVRELIDAGADIAFKDIKGMTALQHAAKHKHRDVVALLLAKANELKNANK